MSDIVTSARRVNANTMPFQMKSVQNAEQIIQKNHGIAVCITVAKNQRKTAVAQNRSSSAIWKTS